MATQRLIFPRSIPPYHHIAERLHRVLHLRVMSVTESIPTVASHH